MSLTPAAAARRARRLAAASNLLGLSGLTGAALATAALAGGWWGALVASAEALAVAYALHTQADAAEAAGRRRPAG